MTDTGNLSPTYLLAAYRLDKLRRDFKSGKLDRVHFVDGLRYLGFSDGHIKLEIEEHRP
jgi:hypothetical protein